MTLRPIGSSIWVILAIASGLIFQSAWTRSAWGQVVVDGTTQTRVRGDCANQCTINGDTLTGTNRNLFHSFRRFSIPNNGNVRFADPGVRNILVRVTGRQPSRLLGTLGVGGTANLFLLNPRGIVFGSNAQLDVGGTFVATTASAFEFGDRGEFGVTPSDTAPTLLNIQPSALLFQGQDAAPILSSAALSVPSGESLMLIGGPVRLNRSQLNALDGRIALVGAGGTGAIAFTDGGRGVSVPEDMRRSPVRLTFFSRASVQSGDLDIDAQRFVLDGFSTLESGIGGAAGSIAIWVTDQAILSNSSRIENTTSQSGRPGLIQIQADQLVLQNQSNILSLTTGAGEGGLIDIQTQAVTLENGSTVAANTVGAGDAGSIQLQAEDALVLSSSDITSSSNAFSAQQGRAGDIILETSSLRLSEFSRVLAAVVGNNGRGGSIQIEADTVTIETTSRISASVDGDRPGGNILIDANQVTLSDGGTIAATTRGQGNGGNIELQNLEALVLRGNSLIAAEATTGGDGGNLAIAADWVVAAPNENSDLIANAQDGAGGNIIITTRGLFGIEPRPSTPTNITNDIDASSRFGPDGLVEINRIEVDPNRRPIELPDALVDVAALIDRGVCQATESSSFSTIGRGGVPDTASDPLARADLWEDWRRIIIHESPADSPDNPIEESPGAAPTDPQRVSPAYPVEAQSWMITDQGHIQLTADVPPSPLPLKFPGGMIRDCPERD